MTREEINEDISCPECGCQDFYREGTVSGRYCCHYNMETGEPSDNTHIHDGIYYNERKKCYCTNCLKELPKRVRDILNKRIEDFRKD